ncbi:hypothetical protein BOTCAL_0258g00030 [Botryotinia calthae]|uniref:Uncharacterized protein n=1 Tax=Botryotinia calthae TaxID=38488 RepID=A0A4Y8CW79_9HELO|nr:hypothetical protein BOTCAL_0258g00030 [Botryotinia calthae]
MDKSSLIVEHDTSSLSGRRNSANPHMPVGSSAEQFRVTQSETPMFAESKVIKCVSCPKQHAMSVQAQTLAEWVTELNDTLSIQTSAEIALKAVHEQVDSSLVVKINHNIYTYDQFEPGLQYVRSSGTMIQDTFSVLLQWENPEKSDDVVAVLSKTTFKENATSKVTKKTNVILWEVKWIDGKRKLSGQTGVEAA